MAARGLALLFVLMLTTAYLPVTAGASGTVGLGMNQDSVRPLTEAGVPPAYGSFWVGLWTATHGWGALENALRENVAAGTTPVIFWYYWGDSISPTCVEQGCDGRTKEQWVSMTATLAQKVRDHMGGRETIIVLENEFNKGGITDTSYAPTFDTYLAARAQEMKVVPGVKAVLGYGSWGEDAWKRFPKAIEASDMIGFQMMRASTRDSESSFRGAADEIARFASFSGSLAPGKQSFLYDLALSSYPEPGWSTIQAETLQTIMDRRGEYAGLGLVGIVYRELRDNPSMGTHNWYGVAEQYWGFWDIYGNHKPSWNVWLGAHGQQPEAPAPAANVPGAFEAESMVATAGGRIADASASGGAVWNIWSNGEIRQAIASAGGEHDIVVVARGDSAEGVNPRMDVRLDGRTLASFDVAAGALREHKVRAVLPENSSTLSVVFTNDVRTSTEDRNLIVDVVRVSAAPTNLAPVARFAASVQDLVVAVDASTSSDPEGEALSYAWSFGDGATATGVRANHTYAQPGEYDVTLRVTDARGGESNTTQTLTVARANGAPTASFEMSGRDLAWSFDGRASSDPDGDALTYAWSFGDGAKATGATANHTYAATGAYTVTLTVTDAEGATASATRSLSATQPNRAPTASFNTTGGNLSWAFDASASADADGDALTYAWSFGDGKHGIGRNVEHAYAAPGAYTVTLTVSDTHGANATSSRTVTATQPNRAPIAVMNWTGNNLSWSFDGRGSADADGDALTYAWSFGDGKRSTSAFVNHTYAAAGNYTVTLTVSDPHGANTTATRTITAAQPNRAPIASIVVGGKEMSYTFDASASTDPDGDALQYLWEFGDGRTAGGAFVSHTYTVAGEYVVKLKVSDGRGAIAEDVRAIHAAPPPAPAAPAPAYRASQAESFAVKDNGIAFSDGAASNATAWLLWSNGGIHQAFRPGNGTFRVEVVAKGDYAGGWPTMELREEGATVARFTVASDTWMSYQAEMTFAEGQTRNISVHFTNDFLGSIGDRNLRLDVVRVLPPSMMVEAEDFAMQGVGGVYTDPTASGGKAWLLWSNGAIGHSIPGQGGTWTVEVVAKGDYARGWPIMELRLDGVAVARWNVTSATWQSYKADIALPPSGATELTVHFLNEYSHRKHGDRNLYVDQITLTPTLP